MLEPFTPAARAVISSAMAEAHHLDHEFLIPCHLLLGLLRPESDLAYAIQTCGAKLDDLRDAIGHIMMPSGDPALQITPAFKTILDEAVMEAQALGAAQADEAHLVLGLIASEDGATMQALGAVGIDPIELRREILLHLGLHMIGLPPQAGSGTTSGPPGAQQLERIRRCLIDPVPRARLKALDKARALDQSSRRNLIAACNIAGQTTLSDEIVILLAENWIDWPTLTTLCLRGCHFLTYAGAAIIARQGKIADLHLAGVPVTAELLIELAKLPLRKLVLWDSADHAFDFRVPRRSNVEAAPVARGAAALARLPTLTHLEWHNAPGEPDVSTALASSPALETLAYTRKESTAAMLAPLGAMERLKDLDIFSVDDAGLRTVTGLPGLERLKVEHSPRVTDAGLASLRTCDRLRYFHLSDAKVTPTGLLHLAKLANLEEIQLFGMDGVLLTNAVATAFGALPRLERLSISAKADLDDHGVEGLARATRLRDLSLNECDRVGDGAMPHIGRLTALETLRLGGTSISDAGANHLSGLVGLHELELRRTAITAAALSSLKPLTGLRLLNANDCPGLAPMDLEPLLGMAHLRELGLQGAGPLDEHQTRRLAQYCRELRKLRCGLYGAGAVAPLTLLPDLRSLWITSADGIDDAEWGQLASLRNLWSMVIIDAPWLTDAALDVFGRMTSLEAVGIAGCPAVTHTAVQTLASQLHLDCMSRSGRRILARGEFVILSGQLLCEGRSAFDRGVPERRSPKGAGEDEMIASLAQAALAPYRAPIDNGDVRRRLRDPDPEEAAQDAIQELEAIGGPAVVPALASALAIGPTRWAYAGWALVRLAHADVTEARAALVRAQELGATAADRERARSFLARLPA